MEPLHEPRPLLPPHPSQRHMDPLPLIELHSIPFLQNESKDDEFHFVPFSFHEGFFLRLQRASLDESQEEFLG